MPKKDEFTTIAQSLITEVEQDAKAISPKLFPERLPDTERMTEAQYVDYVRANWGSIDFRRGLLQRVGPKNFLATAKRTIGEDSGMA